MAKVHRKKYKCDICLRVFDFKSSFDLHYYIHSEENCKCESCGKIFSDPRSMKRHVSVVHNKSRLQCSLCDDEFRYTFQLNEHFALIHEKSKSSACKDCGKVYKDIAYLRRHIKTMLQKIFCEVWFESSYENSYSDEILSMWFLYQIISKFRQLETSH